jgi:hypothetical protein
MHSVPAGARSPESQISILAKHSPGQILSTRLGMDAMFDCGEACHSPCNGASDPACCSLDLKKSRTGTMRLAGKSPGHYVSNTLSRWLAKNCLPCPVPFFRLLHRRGVDCGARFLEYFVRRHTGRQLYQLQAVFRYVDDTQIGNDPVHHANAG